jgi:hypothetical protein
LSNEFILAASSRTPEVSLNYDTGALTLSGECYPEDASQFFGALNEALDKHFSNAKNLSTNISLIYFNSSSARALMELMDKLEDKAKTGSHISVVWSCDEDDDVTQEFVEDLLSDYSAMQLKVDLIKSE